MDKLVGINVDGASVKLGKHKGVGVLLKQKKPMDANDTLF